MSTTRLPPELESALDRDGGFHKSDDFVLVRPDVFRELIGFDLDDETFLAKLRQGLAELDRGECEVWDLQSILAEAHKLHEDGAL